MKHPASQFCYPRMIGGLIALLLCSTCAGCSWVRAAVTRHETKALQMVEAAREAQEQGDVEQAVDLFGRAVETNPQDADLRRELGEMLLSLGRKQEAVEHLRYALQQNPDDATGQAQLASVLAGLGEFAEAGRSVEEALTIDPELVDALLLKSELAERNYDDLTSMDACHRILTVDPENNEARLRLAAIHSRAARPEREAALLRSVSQSPEATPAQKSQARWSLGITYGRKGRWNEAVEALKASSKDRGNLTADDWYRLAYAHYQTGDREATAHDLSRALNLRPDHAASLAMFATLPLFSGQIGQTSQRISQAGFVPPGLPRPAGW